MNGTWNPGFNAGFNDSIGAGFSNNPTNFDSPAGQKKGSVRRLQSVVPVVIRMIRDCHDEEFKLFGMPVQMVTIVGSLTAFDMQSTKATYTINDRTGDIKALWWLESDGGDETPRLPTVKEGGLVRVFGSIRSQDGEKNLMVLKMLPIDDCNVFTTHLLEVINTRLQAEAMSKDTAQMIRQNNPGANLANSMTMFDENIADNGQLNLNGVQLRVFKILQADQNQAGPDRSSILAHFPGNQRREANEALEFLVNEGHAYTTIDNEHFKTTEV